MCAALHDGLDSGQHTQEHRSCLNAGILIYIESGYGLMLDRGLWSITCLPTGCSPALQEESNAGTQSLQGTDDVECGASEGSEIRVTNFQKVKNM